MPLLKGHHRILLVVSAAIFGVAAYMQRRKDCRCRYFALLMSGIALMVATITREKNWETAPGPVQLEKAGSITSGNPPQLEAPSPKTHPSSTNGQR